MASLKELRNEYVAHPTRAALRAYLIALARTGRYDRRMFRYYGVTPVETPAIKAAVVRAYAAGLVPTSTTGGTHAVTSLHFQRRAVDFGLIERHVGTKYGRDKLARFQRAEHARDRAGRVRFTELIGPNNTLVILRGRETDLVEGTPLETSHDNHVHEGF